MVKDVIASPVDVPLDASALTFLTAATLQVLLSSSNDQILYLHAAEAAHATPELKRSM